MQVGDRIRALRKDRGLTQAQLAEKLGVSVMAISQWERSETAPTMAKLYSLADALGTSPAKIVASDDELVIDVTQLTSEQRNVVFQFIRLRD